MSGVLITALFALYVADASLPANAFEPPAQHRGLIRQLMPQGWAFFTRDPREADMRAWRSAGDGGWSPVLARPQAAPANLFGLSRRDNAASIEMGLLY